MKIKLFIIILMLIAVLLLPLSSPLHAQGSLTLSSTTVAPGGTAALSLSLAAPPPPNLLQAVQWTFNYPATSVASLSVTAGPALSSAVKTLSCAARVGSYQCIASGLNSTAISTGVIATLSVKLSGGGALPVTISNIMGASATGDPVALAGLGGGVNVAAAISSFNCSPGTLAPNAASTCTVILNGAGGGSVGLSSSSTSLKVPALFPVPAGSVSGTFSVSANAFTTDQIATVTATLNGSSKLASLSLVAPPTTTSLGCATGSLTSNASTTCTLTLSKAAPVAGVSVSLSSSLPSQLAVPGTLPVVAGATSATFTASAATITASQSAVITAALGTAKATASISLVQTETLKLLSPSCTPAVLSPGISGSCLISFSTPATSSTIVTLKSNNTAFSAPSTLTIAKGSTSGTVAFTTTSALTGSVAIVAIFGSAIQTFTFSVSTKSNTTPTHLTSLSCAKSITSGTSGVCHLRLSPSGDSQPTAISLSSTSSRLKVPGTLLADPGETAIRFEVTADPEASEETAVLEARVGENAVRESLAVSSFGPHLLAPAKITGMPATALKFAVTATGAATITATGLPSGSVFDANAGAFAWTPLAGDLGAHEISFLATDARGARAARTVVVFIGTGAPVVRQLRNLAGGGVCSPGAIAALSGWFLARGEAPLADRSGRSDSLGQTRVLVNGAYVPILSASADWVEFLCPILPVTMPLEIAVETPSGRSSFLQTTMQETAPAILSVDSSQKSQALAIRSNTAELAALPNFRLRARPALSGELVSFWATGIECAASPRLSLILGGHPVSIDSAHPVSEIAGTCEISFRTPVDVSGDAVSLMIQTIQGNSAVSTSNRTSLAIRSSAQEADPGNWNL